MAIDKLIYVAVGAVEAVGVFKEVVVKEMNQDIRTKTTK